MSIKNISFLILLFTVFVNSCKVQEKTNQVSSFETSVPEKYFQGKLDLDQAEDDFLLQLSKIKSKAFLKNYELVLSNNRNDISASVLDEIGGARQSFYIKSTDNSLFIFSDYYEGLRNGLYWYLKELGFRWFFPGEIWEEIPSKNTSLRSFDKTVIPSFGNRMFSGGGGFPNNHPGDPNNSIKIEWTKWQHRNLFGEEIKARGHSWQEFIRRNLDELLKHPEYLAKPLNPKKPKGTTKLCVGNPDLVRLFIKDRRSKIKELIKRFGKRSINAQTISVEPSDGGDHCNCERCLAIGSISDRVFYLANKVAEDLEFDFPDVLVALLAYHEHSEIPNIKLHPNLFVTIIPFKFQYKDFPEDFIRKWQLKHKRIDIYDYWGALIMRKGKPAINFLDKVQEDLRLVDKYDLVGIRVEATYSIGAVGVPLYLLGELSFDYNEDFENTYNLFLEACFGNAAGIMESIFERWSNQDFNADFEKHIIYKELNDAKSVVKLAKYKDRIESYEKYVNFLFYADDVEKSKKDVAKLNENLDKLIEYSWAIKDDFMVHSYWISSPFMRLYNNKRYNNSYKQRERNFPASYWKNLKATPHPYSKRILNSKVEGLVENKNFKNRSSILKIDNKNIIKKVNLVARKSFSLEYSAKSRDEINFNIKTEKISKTRFGSGLKVGIFDQDNNIVYSKYYKDANGDIAFTYNFSKEGDYSVKFSIVNLKFDMSFDASSSFSFFPGTPISVQPYFLYPQEEDMELVIKARQFKCFDRNKNRLKSEKVDGTIHLLKLNAEENEKIKFESSTVVNILNISDLRFYFL